MACRHYCCDVFIAFCRRPSRIGMLGYGIVHDSIFHYQSYILSNTRLSLRKGRKENVEYTLGICHSVSRRNMDFL